MTHISEKAKEFYGIVHFIDVQKVLWQIEVTAREERPEELSDLDQEDLDKLVGLLARYYSMLKRLG